MSYSKPFIPKQLRLFVILLACGIATVLVTRKASPVPPTVKPWRSLQTHGTRAEAILALAFFPDEAKLASGDNVGNMQVWELANSAIIRNWRTSEQGISSLAVTPDGRMLASGTVGWNTRRQESVDGAFMLWPTGAAKAKRSFAMNSGIRQIHFGSKQLFLTTDFYTFAIRDSNSGKSIRSLNYAGDRFALSPDEKWIAFANMKSSVRILNLANDRLVAQFNFPKTKLPSGPISHIPPPPQVRAIAFLPDGDSVVAAGRCEGSTVHVWSIRSGRELAALPITEEIQAGALSPDGKTFVTSSRGGVKLWSTSTWKIEKVLDVPQGANIVVLAFSQDSKLLATAGIGSTIQVWRLSP